MVYQPQSAGGGDAIGGLAWLHGFQCFHLPTVFIDLVEGVVTASRRSADIPFVKQLDNQNHLFGLKMRTQIPHVEGQHLGH